MRLLSLLVVLAGLLMPLPGLPAIPDGSEVTVVRDDLQSRLASGTVRNGELSLSPRLSGGTRVEVWIGVQLKPGADARADIRSFPGRVTDDAQDITLDANRGTSFKQLLEDVYHIKLKLKR